MDAHGVFKWTPVGQYPAEFCCATWTNTAPPGPSVAHWTHLCTLLDGHVPDQPHQCHCGTAWLNPKRDDDGQPAQGTLPQESERAAP